jgi:hexosaminidase
VEGIEWVIQCIQIEDYPRFGWRGLMLDSGRYFMPKEFIKKLINLLALHKMNVFHWHLTDDQGWRIEIKKYPRLTEVGAWRKETLVGHFDITRLRPRYDKRPHGGFYSQDDVREIVACARQRFVTVVPEIEMPGHAQAAIAAYPELGNLAARWKSAVPGGSTKMFSMPTKVRFCSFKMCWPKCWICSPASLSTLAGMSARRSSGATAGLCRRACTNWDCATRMNCKATLSAAWTLFSTPTAAA